MKKMLKQPSPQDGDGTFGQASLWPPCVLWHHTEMMKGSLLSELLVHITESRYPHPLAIGRTILLPPEVLLS